jgi:pyruvate dehydrogenase E2 component (dihydrolipoamide acetyltransferase)
MPIKILMPALSPTMTEGNLVRWLKHEGDTVSAGDIIAEIETDKATMEVEVADDGTLGRILVPAGSNHVKVNEVIALLLEEGEDPSSLDAFIDAAPPSSSAKNVSPSSPIISFPEKATPSSPLSSTALPQQQQNARVVATPLARRLAKERGINLHQIVGTGPRGRIIKADIDHVVAQQNKGQDRSVGSFIPLSASGARPVPGSVAGATSMPSIPGGVTAPRHISPVSGSPSSADDLFPPYEAIPLSNMRRIIAKRLTEAKQTVPHFYLTVETEIDTLLTLRKEINQNVEEAERISVNDFVIKAIAMALMAVPAANAAWAETHIRHYRSADISVAVAVEGGVVTPVIRAAETKTLRAISQEVKALISKARAGKLRPEEYQGGTFSLSNLGMYGIQSFTAVVNPPQGCILAVGAGEPKPVVKNGQLHIATVMSCTLSVDHRVVDGAVGADFLQHFKKYIQHPVLMLA